MEQSGFFLNTLAQTINIFISSIKKLKKLLELYSVERANSPY